MLIVAVGDKKESQNNNTNNYRGGWLGPQRSVRTVQIPAVAACFWVQQNIQSIPTVPCKIDVLSGLLK